MVTAVTPLNAATGVAITNSSIAATFSEPMKPLVAANFTLTCAAPCVNATGTVALDSTNTIATFTPALSLAPNTLYTATVSGATSLSTGFALASALCMNLQDRDNGCAHGDRNRAGE